MKIIALALFIVLSACTVPKPGNDSMMTRLPKKKGEIRIGMYSEEFWSICYGEPYNVSQSESKDKFTYTFKIDYSDKSGDRLCYGAFTFENDELTHVKR
jgi:hypothetical protein